MAQKERFCDLLLLVLITLFLLSYFKPDYLFSPTITTGGDTPSHYDTARYLKAYLLPQGKISGWYLGNLAGFPMLQNYFPLPFMLMALLSWGVGLPIAFKLVSVLGIFLLPWCTYLFFRCLKQPFPVPVIGAVLSLCFLFIESYSMWGGNIPSTLAGTFCYSIGFALLVLWLGILYDTVSNRKPLWRCMLLLAGIGFCHGYTLVIGAVASAFFLFPLKDFGPNLKKLLQIHLGGFGLMAFWLVPLLVFLPQTTPFSLEWHFSGWRHFMQVLFPVIAFPATALTLIGVVLLVHRHQEDRQKIVFRPWTYIGFTVLVSFGLYGIGTRFGLVDIRFLPPAQFWLITAGGLGFSVLKLPPRARLVIPCFLFCLAVLWVPARETYIHDWIRYNYTGFEQKPLWSAFGRINRFLQGSVADARVAYEHSPLNEGAGSVRAFESLPLFSGRLTLEGVYFQASLCAPFIYYLQSETSRTPSMPFREYNYSRFDLKRGLEHLNLFNVSHFIAVSPETKQAARAFPGLRFRFRADPYEVYENIENQNRYVEPLFFKPVLAGTQDWRRMAYRWFRLGDLDVPLVFCDRIDPADASRFVTLKEMDVRNLPRHPLPAVTGLKETVSNEEICIQNAPVGHPLLIKISYHPGWQVKGAKRIYRASPAFMLIFPTSPEVRLRFQRTWPDFVGMAMSAGTLLFLFIIRTPRLRRFDRKCTAFLNRFGRKTAFVLILLFAIFIFHYLWTSPPQSGTGPYLAGMRNFGFKEYDIAAGYFKKVIENYPQTSVVDEAGFFYAMCFFLRSDWAGSLRALTWLLETYPETRRAAEAEYHQGLCALKLGQKEAARVYLEKTITEYPETSWAGYAREQLKELD